jgi:glycosyltransferase involved in cell wall biosynthesis
MCSLVIPASIPWELLVVNNNCTDETDETISRYAQRLPLRRLVEPKPGLSNARNCAMSATTGDLLIWTDDDVLVDPNWVVEYVKAANTSPGFSYFGGTIEPWFESQPPHWIASNLNLLQGPYAVRELGEQVRPLNEEEDPFGANMGMRTQLARELGFDSRLGRRPDSLASAEETDLFSRMKRLGHRGLWIGPAKVRHFIPTARLTTQYLKKWFYEGGRSNVRMDGINENWRWAGDVPLFALKALWLSRVNRALLWPIKGQLWTRAFRDAAYFRGYIDEAGCARKAWRTTGACLETSRIAQVRVANR